MVPGLRMRSKISTLQPEVLPISTLCNSIVGESLTPQKIEYQETEVNNLAPVHPNHKGARAITARIRREIEIGSYANGDQLPAERELSGRFGASRSTIRKALTNLEKAGIVIRKVGSGTFVNYVKPDEFEVTNVIDSISPIQLIDARIGIERQMTRLAVINATARDLEIMESVLRRLEESKRDKDDFTHWDSEFHLLLAKCSRNPLILHLYEQVNEVRSHSQWSASKEWVLTPENIAGYNRCHLAIFEAIRNRDPAGAIDALNNHMDLARAHLLGSGSDI